MAENYKIPGIYRQDVYPAPEVELRTGVPVFLGYTRICPESVKGEKGYDVPHMLTIWSQFAEIFGKTLPNGYLAHAVRGFFDNGGRLCYVVPLKPAGSGKESFDLLEKGLGAIEPLQTIDLVCAPDIMRPRSDSKHDFLPESLDDVARMQKAVFDHCDQMGDRFAILDSRPCAGPEDVLDQRQGLKGINGAIYYPWVRVLDGPALTGGFVPPCGHIAGVYARSDQRVGVYKAPANEILEGVTDLEFDLADSDQGRLNPKGVNCLRAFPGRGIRVWGARTLNSDADDDGGSWRYINVRRLFLTAGRWIERNMASEVFEPNEPGLWARITRELTDYFNDLYRQGALKGRTAGEAFYVKCDAETNPPEAREAGNVVTEIGLAPTRPSEFVTVRIIHGSSGVTISGPARPAE